MKKINIDRLIQKMNVSDQVKGYFNELKFEFNNHEDHENDPKNYILDLWSLMI